MAKWNGWKRVEWPTLMLAVAVYTGWIGITVVAHRFPALLLAVPGGWLIAWHGSLQHEAIHGHPTRSRLLNGLIAYPPLALWLPFAAYRRDHLAHHRTHAITDPILDPESRYLSADATSASRVRRAAEAAQATLFGRLLLGPAVTALGFIAGEVTRLRRRPREAIQDWLPHLAGVAAILWWLDRCDIGSGTYLLCFVYPGIALSLLRSFAEHRADPTPGHRVAIVERAGPFALLFLHNNLHAAHHARPWLAWYRLPAFYHANRAALLEDNGGLFYRGYGDVARRFLFRPHDRIVHPDHVAT